MTSTRLAEPPLPLPEDILLIVSDVDGTLLTSQHVIHTRTQQAVRSLRRSRPSLPFVIASGKQYNSCAWMRRPDALDLHEDCPALHCHGCLAYGKGGELITSVGLAPEAIASVVVGLHDHAVFLFTPDDVYLVQDDGLQDWLTIARRYDHNVHDARSQVERAALLERIRSGELAIVKVTVGSTPEEAEASRLRIQELHDKFPSPPWKCTRAISFILELVPPHMDKAVALAALCAKLDIPLSRVVAFGDGDNDSRMLSEVGYGVAMGNAMPSAVQAARYRTATNDEGGVGLWLERVYGESVAVEKL